jgi:hypothetical protein
VNEYFIEKIQEFSANLIASYRSKQFAEVDERLRNLLVLACDIDEKDHVLSMFVNHYHFIGDSLHARKALQERIALSPEQVEGWLGLTEHFHYHEEDLDKAAQTVEIALQKALAQNRQVRQILGVRIRIALKKNDYARVNDSLLMLLEYVLPQGGFDVELESDFILQISPEATTGDVLSRYKGLANFKDCETEPGGVVLDRPTVTGHERTVR